jgi:RNA polymerase sigma-70 factor (ECF subfamily)
MNEPKPDSCDDSFHGSPLFQVFIDCAKELRSFLTRRLGCAEVAADLVQDTYIRLATRPDPDVHANPRALVFRVAANLATDHSRKQRLRDTYDGGTLDDLAVPSLVPAPDAELTAQQDHALLKQAIARLPEKRRTVFLLRMAQGLPYDQIASRVGISVSAVEKHMSQAIVHCRTYVERHHGAGDD